jgi:hypothetical protein
VIHPRLLLGLLALWAAGCGSPHPAGAPGSTIGKDEFIEVYLELRRAAVQADSGPAFDLIKREILERHGISGQDLIDYIETHSSDLREMTATWDTIYQRLDRKDTIPTD